MMTAESAACRVCGAPLDPLRSGGLCAACLLGDALDGPMARDFSGHELIEEIARGGMGVVYRARQREPEREVALKTMHGVELDSATARARFEHEARAMAELEHPAILPVFTFGEEDGVPFFTMKLARGGTLASRLATYAGQWRAIAELMATVAEAVHHAHERSVLHRDLKPGNILFDEADRPHVSDFGIAKLAGEAQSHITLATEMLGTPRYMAPEVAIKGARAATISSDVWSLGVMLYELLAQTPPFDAESAPALLRTIAETDPPPPRKAPRDLAVIALKALEKDSTRRFASARHFADDLRRWLAGRPIHARGVRLHERAWLWARRRPALAALASLLLLTLALSAALLVHSNRELLAVDRQRQAEMHRVLVEQADAERQSLRPGRRARALALVREALTHGASLQARSVAASALAVCDLQIGEGHAIGRLAPGQSPMAFTPELDHYLALVPSGQVSDRMWKQGAVGLWREADGKLVRQFPLTDRAGFSNPALSPDARWACLTMKRNFLEIWDCQNGTLAGTIKSSLNTAGCFHPSDGTLIACIDGKLVRIHLPELRSEPIVSGLTECAGLVVSPDGEKVALFQRDPQTAGRTEVRSLVDGRLIKQAERSPYGRPAWSSDSRLLAVFNAFSGNLMVHDTADPEANAQLVARTVSTGRRVAFRPDGRTIAWVDNDGFLKLRDTWIREHTLQVSATGMNVAFSGDGKRLAFNPASDTVAFAEVLDSPVLLERKATFVERSVDRHLAVSPDGRWVATCDLAGLALWQTDGLRNVAHAAVKLGASLSTLHFSADSRQVRFHAQTPNHTVCDIIESADGSVKLDAPDPKSPPSPHTLVAASADGKWEHTVRSDEKKTVAYLWQDGKIVRKVKRQTNPYELDVAFVATAPDGRWYVISGMTVERSGKPGFTNVTFFDADFHHLTLSSDSANSRLAVSADSRWLVAGERSDYVIWDTATWRPALRVAEQLSDSVPGSAAFSPDGRLLALEVEHSRIRLLRTGTWEEVVTLTPPQLVSIVCMTFSHDGRYLYTTGQQILSRWDLQTLRAKLKGLGLDW